jgi:nucleoid DNA-binding protein
MLKSNELFKKISAKCGNLDVLAVRGVYVAMVRTMLEELKNGYAVDLPNMGTFEVRSYKKGRKKDKIVKYMFFLSDETLNFYINS